MAEKKLKSVANAIKAKTSIKAKSGNVVAGKSGVAKTINVQTVKKTASKTGKSPAARKVLAPAAKSKALPKSLATRTQPTDATAKTKLTPEERYRMVETAAYFIAEQHGFHGRTDEHWASAERQIAVVLGQ